MRYAVKHVFLRTSNDVEQILPEGWEPIGGEVEAGGDLRLVLVRQLSEEEETAAEAAETTVRDARVLREKVSKRARKKT